MKAADEIRERVETVLRSLGVVQSPIDFDTSLTELGLDSLNTMDLILSLEDACGVEVPEAELNPNNLKTPGTVSALFDRLRRSND